MNIFSWYKFLKLRHLLLAIFVTLLWSSSFIIIKIYIDEIPPLFFAGIRYLIASSILWIFLVNGKLKSDRKVLQASHLKVLVVYGLIFITATQGFGFLTLKYLSPVTMSFVLNFTTVLVAIISYFFLHETTSWQQILLIILALFGAIIYFYPLDMSNNSLFGYLFLICALIGNSISTVFGRYVNEKFVLSSLFITTISMTAGSLFLIIWSFFVENWSPLSVTAWIAITWLAVFNTSFAFWIWNYTQQYIPATYSSLILNTILPQVTILSIIFLDIFPTTNEWLGLLIIIISITTVLYLGQQRRQKL